MKRRALLETPRRTTRPLLGPTLLVLALGGTACQADSVPGQACATHADCDGGVCRNGRCTAGAVLGEGDATLDVQLFDAPEVRDAAATEPDNRLDAILAEDGGADSSPNACGGVGPLEAAPDSPCEHCLGGTWVCDGAESVRCDCPPANGTCERPFELVAGSSRHFSLCELADDHRNVEGPECGVHDFVGRDAVFQFTLEEASSVTLQLMDSDVEVGVDTVLYLRRDCGDASSQVACNDDAVCTDANADLGPCINGFQPRHSIVRAELGPGTYFVIADQYDVSFGGVTFECGTVRLELDLGD